MSRLNAVMAFLVVSCYHSPVFSELPIIQSKSYNFGNREVIVGKKSIDNTTFLYAVCETTPDERSANCRINFESDVFDISKPNFSCDLDLVSKLTNGKLDILEINLWDHDKAIFMWQDINQDNLRYRNVTINVVILENCNLKVHTFKADNRHDNKSQIFIFPRDNTYDLAFMDSDLCENMFCKVTVTIDGAVSEAVSWFRNTGFVAGLETTNDDSKKLLINYEESIRYSPHLKSYLVHDVGWSILVSNPYRCPVGWSTSNGYISICLERHCQLFDQDGKFTRAIDLLMLHYPTMYAISYNLPNYQQLSLVCTTDLDGNYRILRFNSRGELIYIFPIQDLKCAHKPEVFTGEFLVIRHGQYCLSLFFSDYKSLDAYKFHKYCFNGLSVNLSATIFDV